MGDNVTILEIRLEILSKVNHFRILFIISTKLLVLQISYRVNPANMRCISEISIRSVLRETSQRTLRKIFQKYRPPFQKKKKGFV